MADISRKRAETFGTIFTSTDASAGSAEAHTPSSVPDAVADADHTTLVELLFFAYRDFTGESDAILAEFNLGRAHHRALHFVMRQPGLRVADLLAILKITKQSLARVLTPLIADGWIESRAGPDDRRERLLFLSARGSALVERLVKHQSQQIGEALATVGRDGACDAAQERVLRRFLFAMISADERDKVAALLKISAANAATDLPAGKS